MRGKEKRSHPSFKCAQEKKVLVPQGKKGSPAPNLVKWKRNKEDQQHNEEEKERRWGGKSVGMRQLLQRRTKREPTDFRGIRKEFVRSLGVGEACHRLPRREKGLAIEKLNLTPVGQAISSICSELLFKAGGGEAIVLVRKKSVFSMKREGTTPRARRGGATK